MPKSVCFYFQVHQPYRINMVDNPETAKVEDFFHGPMGDNPNYVYGNQNLFEEVARNCYIPATQKWLELLETHSELHITLSLSGVFLEQCQQWPEYGLPALEGFKKLLATGRVEFLGETYNHSLSFFFSKQDYLDQIQEHQEVMQKLFDYRPKAFRNTELIYNNHIGNLIRGLGYSAIVAEGSRDILQTLPAGKVFKIPILDLSPSEQAMVDALAFQDPNQQEIRLVTRDFEVTQEMIFLNKGEEVVLEIIDRHPEDLITIFTDFEIFGQINSASGGVFERIEKLLGQLQDRGFIFETVSQASKRPTDQIYNCPEFTSWANQQQNLVSWRGNPWQEQAFEMLVQTLPLAERLRTDQGKEGRKLRRFWQKLTISDHFYYMSDLEGPDGAVHAMFNAFPSPKDAYDTYVAVLNHFKQRLQIYLDSQDNN